MRIDINKEDIKILLELINNQIIFNENIKKGLKYLNITKKEEKERIKNHNIIKKKLIKIHNKLFDKIIEMEYYEEQNTKHKNNGTDNTFFNHVADILSRDYRNEEKPSTDN